LDTVYESLVVGLLKVTKIEVPSQGTHLVVRTNVLIPGEENSPISEDAVLQ
jgi:hypothetical protein